MNKYQKLFDEASEEVKAKVLAMDDFWTNDKGEFELTPNFEQPCGFKAQIKAMESKYYLELVEPSEGETFDAKGVETIEEVIDLLLAAPDKYGSWVAYKFEDGKWYVGELQRVGKVIELLWKVKE